MKRLHYILAALIICVSTVRAGDDSSGLSKDTWKAVLTLASQGAQSVDSIKALLALEGYLHSYVKYDSGGVKILPCRQSVIKRIVWILDAVVEEDVDIPFTKVDVERLMEERLRRYRKSGHLYAGARILKISRNGFEVTLSIYLTAGPPLIYGTSLFPGLKRTRPELIARYLPFDSGSVLSEDKLLNSEHRAAEIPFVKFQPPLKVKPLPGYTGADLEYSFEEKKQVLLSGGGGYVPGSSSSLVWSLDLTFQNLFGGGRLIHLLSERREEKRQVLDVGYRQPAFWLGAGEAGLSVATRDYRDQFYEFLLKADYYTHLSRSFFTGLELSWRSVEPSGEEPSFHSLSSAFTIESNNIDDPVNASSGAGLSWTISFGYRRYSTDSLDARPEQNSYNETRTSVRAEWYRRLKANLIGHIRLEYHGLETGESLPPLSELFLVGGPPAIRGYRNEQFTAIRTAYGSIEPRLRFDSGYLFLFYDGAYINNRVAGLSGDVFTDEFYRYSYGLGTAIVDRGRSVKISVGWNPDLLFDQPRLSLEFSSEI